MAVDLSKQLFSELEWKHVFVFMLDVLVLICYIRSVLTVRNIGHLSMIKVVYSLSSPCQAISHP